MMGSGQKRGWIIIGMDLLIVLVIYFLYSSFAFESEPVNTVSHQEKFHYTLSVKARADETVPVTITMANKSNRSLTGDFPNGLIVLLTDGGNRKYWSTVLLSSSSISLGPGESRSWTLAAEIPSGENPPFYVEVFMDKSRQLRVTVPS